MKQKVFYILQTFQKLVFYVEALTFSVIAKLFFFSTNQNISRKKEQTG